MTYEIETAKGYSGKMAGKSWIADVTTSMEAPYDFLKGETKWEDKFFKGYKKYTGTIEYTLVEGRLYLVCEFGERRVVRVLADGTTQKLKDGEARVSRIHAYMAANEDATLDEAVAATKE